MEIRELRVYVAVVDEGGLSAAARRLHVSQSSVSETIAALERRLGVPLLVRSRGGARETEAGRRLTDGARRLLMAHDRLRAEVVADPGVSGTVRVGVPLELPAEFLPRATAVVTAANPGLRIEGHHASTSAQWDLLRGGGLEVALVRELAPGDDYDNLLVIEDRLGVVLTSARATEVTSPDGTIQLSDLRRLVWSGFARSEIPAFYDQVIAVLRAHGVRAADPAAGEPGPATPGVKLVGVADGTRFALALPDFPVTDGVVWRPLAGDPIVRRTWAVWRADETSAGVAAFVAALEDAPIVPGLPSSERP